MFGGKPMRSVGGAALLIGLLGAVLVFYPGRLSGDPGCPVSYEGQSVVVTGTVRFRVHIEDRWFTVIEDDGRNRCVVHSEGFVGNEGQYVWLNVMAIDAEEPYLVFAHER